jgi:transposase
MTQEEAQAIYDLGKEAVVATLLKMDERINALETQVKELRDRLGLNSSNSSKPPATNSPFAQKPKTTSNTKRKAGGQKGREGKNLKMVEHPDAVIISVPDVCQDCRVSLIDAQSRLVASRQVFDLPIMKIEVTEHQVHTKRCPCCKTINKGTFPADVTAPTQYGKRFDAAISYLSVHQMLPYERITQVMDDLFGHPISEGVVLNALSRTEAHLSSFNTITKQALLQSKVLHVDETGINVRGKLHWAHIAISNSTAACLLHPKRGMDAIKEMDILPNYRGTVVHDHWRAYESIGGAFDHAFCNAHHLRELNRVAQLDKQQWSEDMSKLLVSANQKVTYAKTNEREALSPRMMKRFNTWYDSIVKSASVYHTTHQPEIGTRGRIKQTFAKNLLDRLIKYKHETLRFATDFTVPFTNNEAERGLRMMKVKEKISGCFMSQKGGRIFMNIYSYILTVKKNGVNIMQALLDAMYGKPFMPLVDKIPAF